MVDPIQVKRGYLRGVRGVLLTELEPTGADKPTAVPYWVDTAQDVDVAAEVVAGESSDLRGGDRLLLRIEEDDTIVGATLTFTDARFDGRASELIGGGTLIVEAIAAAKATAYIGSGENGTVNIEVDAAGVAGNAYTVEVVVAGTVDAALSAAAVGDDLTVTLGTDAQGDPDDAKNTATLVAGAVSGVAGFTASATGTGADPLVAAEAQKSFTDGADTYDEIVGWDAPTVEQQANRIPFKAEVYVQSFNEAGGREAYLKYVFRFCKGTAAEISHSNRSWGTPEFEIKARENPYTLESTHKKEFVAELPVQAPAA